MYSETIPERLSEASIEMRRKAAERRSGWFIKGPLPVVWFGKASTLPGKAVSVGLALWLESGRSGCSKIRLGSALLSHFGVNRWSAHRAVAALESAGLVSVERHRGRNPVVTIHKKARSK